jgi:hypothetical protein
LSLFCFVFILVIKSCWIPCFTHIMFLLLFLLFHNLDLELNMPLFRKSCKLGCFCIHYSLNKLPPSLFWLSLFLLSFVFKSHAYIQGRISNVHGWSPYCLSKFIIKKSSTSWIHCSSPKQSNFNIFGMCFHDPTNVVSANGLVLTLHVNVNPIMKFIYIMCNFKHIIFIYIHVSVSVNVEYKTCKCNVKSCKFILCSIEQCKCKNEYIYKVYVVQ